MQVGRSEYVAKYTKNYETSSHAAGPISVLKLQIKGTVRPYTVEYIYAESHT